MAEAYSTAPSLRPLDANYRYKPRGMFTMAEVGSANFNLGGDFDTFDVTTEIEENDVFSNETPEKSLALVDVTKAEIGISFTSRMLTKQIRRTQMLSSKQTFSQPAAPGQELDATIVVGDIIMLDHMAVTMGAVTSGAVVMVRGLHYECDSETGAFQLLLAPDGVILDAEGALEVHIEYDALEIVNRVAFGFMSQTDIRYTIQFRQKQKWGPQSFFQFWIVQLRPDGNMPLGGDGEDFGTQSFVGRVYPDFTRPAGFQLGRAIDIPKALAA